MKRLTLILALLSGSLAFGQGQNFPGGSGSGSLPTGSVVNGVVQSGLMAQYAFTDNTGTTLTDSSGNSNNGTLCAAGAAPTWIGAPTGGLSFNKASSQCVTLPAALNTAQTIQIFANDQMSSVSGTPLFQCLIAGNGGTKANTTCLAHYEMVGDIGFNNTGTDASPKLAAFKAGPTFVLNGIRAALGTNLITWELDATTDKIYTGTTPVTAVGSVSGSQGVQTSGVYQFGGMGVNYINSNSSFWSGTMYYALFYSRELTVAEIAQNNAAIQQIMANRSLTNVFGNTAISANSYVVDGDSLPGANGAWFAYAFPSTTDGAWQAYYSGVSGQAVVSIQAESSFQSDALCPESPASGNCILNVQIGTNDLSGTSINNFLMRYAQYIAQRKAFGHYTQVWINTILANSLTTAKNTYNTALLQSWQSLGATGIVPVGEDPNIGCDTCNTNAYFNVDHLHPSALGQYEIAHIQQPNINRATNGNFTFSSATTYTTTAAAATAITAASESTNTVTLTFAATPASFVAGVDLTIAGVTPSGYNTSASNVCHVLTRTATTITCLNSTSGLGVGTVFGTASTPMQQDVDAAVILGGSSTTPNFTLESCASWVGGSNVAGWDGRVRIKNSNTTSPWTITPFASETIDGASSLAMPAASSGNNPVVILESQALAPSTGGCNWVRLQ
jgi:hypothetical protein